MAHEASGASSVFSRAAEACGTQRRRYFLQSFVNFGKEHGAAAVWHYFVAARFVEARREVFAARGLHGERGFVSVSPYGWRRHACGDGRFRKSAYAAQRVFDCAAFHRELFFIGNVLELAAAAASEERAARLGARRSVAAAAQNFRDAVIFLFRHKAHFGAFAGERSRHKEDESLVSDADDALAFVVESRYRYVKYISLSHV